MCTTANVLANNRKKPVTSVVKIDRDAAEVVCRKQDAESDPMHGSSGVQIKPMSKSIDKKFKNFRISEADQRGHSAVKNDRNTNASPFDQLDNRSEHLAPDISRISFQQTTDILNGESESRLQYKYAVVLQELFSNRTQSNPTATKSALDTKKSLQRFLPLDQMTISVYTYSPLVLFQPATNVVECMMRPSQVDPRQMELLKELSAESKEGTFTMVVQSGGLSEC